jgi:hypothetical protein
MNKYVRYGLIATGTALLGIVAFQVAVTGLLVHEMTKGVER